MFAFPEWLSDYQLEDAFFANAYESTEPHLRAWLKKTIAQVFEINSPCCPLKSWTVDTWRGGFETEIARSPLDWTVMLVDCESVSPVRLLAALVPALAAGVSNVMVIIEGDGDIPASILAGLELAGQEDVVRLDTSQLDELVGSLSQNRSTGAIIDMRGSENNLICPQSVKYWRGPYISSICVCKDEDSPAMDVLKFAHPDVDFVEIDEESLDTIQADAAVVPPEFVGETLLSCRTVLAHGQEGCWIWNGLNSSYFMQESTALTAAE